MRYIPPTITGTYTANSVVQSRKGAVTRELDHIQLTSGPSYQCEE